ncbi:MAG: hypothetical protein WCJ45_05760 [bacterium]
MRRELELKDKIIGLQNGYLKEKDETAKRKEDDKYNKKEYLLNESIRHQDQFERQRLTEESNSGNTARLKYVKEKIRLD